MSRNKARVWDRLSGVIGRLKDDMIELPLVRNRWGAYSAMANPFFKDNISRTIHFARRLVQNAICITAEITDQDAFDGTW
jgi:hypothetical protein